MGPRLSLVALACASILSCANEADTRTTPRCHLEAATEVARVAAARFDGIALTRLDSKVALAVWSDDSGTYARTLDAPGKPQTEVLRVRDRCRGGVALTTTAAGRVWLACSQPNPVPEAATLVAMRLDARGRAEEPERVLGLVGRDGAGVALASDGERVFVAFHDGTVQAYVARLAIVNGEQVTHVALSDPAFAAGAPSIVARDGHWLAAFSESRIGADASSTRIVLRRDAEPARVLRETSLPEPAPRLAWDGSSAWIAFRDLSSKFPKAELYAARLSETLRLKGELQQIGRANSEGAPTVFACAGQGLALLPRDYAAERYIGVHALDANLSNLGSGHQYYANSREFVLATAACAADGALLLAGERSSPAAPGVSLMAMRFACAR